VLSAQRDIFTTRQTLLELNYSGQRVGYLFKGGLDFLLVVDHLLLLADLRQIEVGRSATSKC
jgi:hypothetical protein